MLRVRLAYKVIGGAILAAAGLVFLFSGGERVTPIFAGVSTKTIANHPSVTFTFDGSARTIEAAFAQADVTYHPADHIQVFPPDIQSGLGGIIVDEQAMPISLTDGTKKFIAYTWASTVGSFLNEQNISLGDDDKVSPAVTSALSQNEPITIVRVAITQLTEKRIIPFDTTRRDDNTLDKGKTKVFKAGVNGEKALLYQVRREDGIEVARTLLSTSITKPSEAEILLIGTKPVITRPCGGFDNTVLAAAIKNNVDPNLLCKGLMLESNGHANSIGGGQYYGLFQYTTSFWAQASAAAGYAGASWSDATAQIYTTAWALNPVRYNQFSSRWFWA